VEPMASPTHHGRSGKASVSWALSSDTLAAFSPDWNGCTSKATMSGRCSPAAALSSPQLVTQWPQGEYGTRNCASNVSMGAANISQGSTHGWDEQTHQLESRASCAGPEPLARHGADSCHAEWLGGFWGYPVNVAGLCDPSLEGQLEVAARDFGGQNHPQAPRPEWPDPYHRAPWLLHNMHQPMQSAPPVVAIGASYARQWQGCAGTDGLPNLPAAQAPSSRHWSDNITGMRQWPCQAASERLLPSQQWQGGAEQYDGGLLSQRTQPNLGHRDKKLLPQLGNGWQQGSPASSLSPRQKPSPLYRHSTAAAGHTRPLMVEDQAPLAIGRGTGVSATAIAVPKGDSGEIPSMWDLPPAWVALPTLSAEGQSPVSATLFSMHTSPEHAATISLPNAMAEHMQRIGIPPAMTGCQRTMASSATASLADMAQSTLFLPASHLPADADAAAPPMATVRKDAHTGALMGTIHNAQGDATAALSTPPSRIAVQLPQLSPAATSHAVFDTADGGNVTLPEGVGPRRRPLSPSSRLFHAVRDRAPECKAELYGVKGWESEGGCKNARVESVGDEAVHVLLALHDGAAEGPLVASFMHLDIRVVLHFVVGVPALAEALVAHGLVCLCLPNLQLEVLHGLRQQCLKGCQVSSSCVTPCIIRPGSGIHPNVFTTAQSPFMLALDTGRP
jgi:hypothetical protein